MPQHFLSTFFKIHFNGHVTKSSGCYVCHQACLSQHLHPAYKLQVWIFRMILTESVVTMVPGTRAERSGFQVSIGATDFYLSCPGRLWGPPSLLQSLYRGSHLDVKRPGHDAHSSTEGRNECCLHLYPCLMQLWCVNGHHILNWYDSHRNKRENYNFSTQCVLLRHYTDQPLVLCNLHKSTVRLLRGTI
jgi:hypothetical protein